MSKATKRKHVQREMYEQYFAPPTSDQKIVRVVNGCGNNLHMVEESDLTRYLVSMPTKFRKNIWVRRGDYVIVEPVKEGTKVKAEMVRVLSKELIKYFKKINVWPNQFDFSFDEKGIVHVPKNSDSTSTTPSQSPLESDEDDEEEEVVEDDTDDTSDEVGLITRWITVKTSCDDTTPAGSTENKVRSPTTVIPVALEQFQMTATTNTSES